MLTNQTTYNLSKQVRIEINNKVNFEEEGNSSHCLKAEVSLS